MKTPISLTVLAAWLLGCTAGALAQERYPTFERNGYPLTLHQLEVLGTERVHQQDPSAALTRDGMPASPHQIEVLRHHDQANH